MAMIAVSNKSRIDKTVASTAVPINGAGVEFDAIAQGAHQVAQFGNELLDKRKRASDNEFVSTQITNDMVEFTRFEAELKKSTPENGAGYSEAVNKWQTDRLEANIKNAPSSDAREVYTSKYRDLSTRNTIQAETTQATLAATHSANQIVNNVNKQASMLLAAPRTDRAAIVKKETDDMIQSNVGVHYDQETADKFKKESSRKIGLSVLDGLDAQENYGVAMGLLKGAGKEGDLLKDFDSEERGRLLKRFDNAMEAKRTKNTLIATENASDYLAAALNGDKLEAGLGNKRIAELQASNLDPEKKTRLIDSVRNAALANEQVQTYSTLPPSKWERPEDVISKSGSGFNAAARERATNALATAQAAIIKQRESDASPYVMANNPKLAMQYKALDPTDPMGSQDFATNMLATQTQLEIKNQRILPKTYTQAIGVALSNNTDTDRALGTIMQIEQQWGPHKNRIMNEVINDNKLDNGYRILPFVSDVNSKKKILDNLRAGKGQAIEKDFTAARGSDTTQKDLKDEVASQLTGYQSAVMSGGANRAPLYTAMSEQVRLQAMRRMTNGEKIGDAVSKAKEEILDNSFHVISAGNAGTLVPKTLVDGRTPVDADAVKNTINYYSKPAGLAELDIHVGADFKAKADLKTKNQFASFWLEENSTGGSVFAKQIAAKVRWVTSVNGDAILPVVADKYGNDISLADSKGQPIRMKFTDINANAVAAAKMANSEKQKILMKNEAKANMDFFKTGN